MTRYNEPGDEYDFIPPPSREFRKQTRVNIWHVVDAIGSMDPTKLKELTYLPGDTVRQARREQRGFGVRRLDPKIYRNVRHWDHVRTQKARKIWRALRVNTRRQRHAYRQALKQWWGI